MTINSLSDLNLPKVKTMPILGISPRPESVLKIIKQREEQTV